MGRGARNQKRTGKGDAKTQSRTDKFVDDAEERFERLNVEDEQNSNNNSEDSSSNEHEDEVSI
jgi:hypothetical protein